MRALPAAAGSLEPRVTTRVSGGPGAQSNQSARGREQGQSCPASQLRKKYPALRIPEKLAQMLLLLDARDDDSQVARKVGQKNEICQI